MKGFVITLVVIAAVIAAIALINDNDTDNATTPTPSATQSSQPSPSPSGTGTGSKNFDLSEQNDSNENGSVVLTEVSGRTRVEVAITNEPSGASQPAHIHVGSCPNPGAVLYSLNPVVNGQSTTTLNVTLTSLKAKGGLAVNVHKSASDLNTYVACGNLSL